MKDYLISMFIDNELGLDDKIEFVDTVHRDGEYAGEAIGLLQQEKLLRGVMVARVPEIQLPAKPETSLPAWFSRLNPVSCLAGALVMVAFMVLFRSAPEVAVPQDREHRFVIYQPEAEQAEIVGSFTNWKPLAMERIGPEGYWSLTLPLSAGEHRYSFLLDKEALIADPTVVSREEDDFGGENSIIRI